jgi:chaperonin GroES
MKGVTMKVKPLGEKVLVKRLEAEAKTKGGIVLPETAKEKPKRGKVIAVGEGKVLEDGGRSQLQVKKGDEVIFTSYAGTEIKIDGEEFMIMDENDILAVVE